MLSYKIITDEKVLDLLPPLAPETFSKIMADETSLCIPIQIVDETSPFKDWIFIYYRIETKSYSELLAFPAHQTEQYESLVQNLESEIVAIVNDILFTKH